MTRNPYEAYAVFAEAHADFARKLADAHKPEQYTDPFWQEVANTIRRRAATGRDKETPEEFLARLARNREQLANVIPFKGGKQC